MVPAVLHCTSCRDSRFWAPLAPSARKRWISWQSSLTSSSLWHWLLAPILSYCPSRFASAFSVSVIVTLRPQAGEPWAACASERIAMHLWQAHVSSLFAVAHTEDQAIQAQDGGNQGWQSNCRTQGADQGLQWWHGSTLFVPSCVQGVILPVNTDWGITLSLCPPCTGFPGHQAVQQATSKDTRYLVPCRMWASSQSQRSVPPLHNASSCLQGVHPQPEILVGDEGAIEVARHPDAESVITGIVGCAG